VGASNHFADLHFQSAPSFLEGTAVKDSIAKTFTIQLSINKIRGECGAYLRKGGFIGQNRSYYTNLSMLNLDFM